MRILLASDNETLSHLIQRTLSRFNYEWVCVNNGFDAFQKIITSRFDLLILSYHLERMYAPEVLKRCTSIENFKIPPSIILTTTEQERHQTESERLPHTLIVARPIAIRRFVTLVQQCLHQGSRAACLGGGTGLFTLLSGLKTIPGLTLSSIVSMSDDGGSTGKLRDIFGILPPGDVRRSLVALSTAPDLLNELIKFRFESGDGLAGHNLGNLLLTALNQMKGSMADAVKALGEILNIQGEVIPVTETMNTLHAELEDGQVIVGESHIGLFEEHHARSRIKSLWQEPKASANPDALEAILNAKWILIGPGDLFTSVIANLVVEGISEAIQSSAAKTVYICNVMTKPGETTNFSVSDHVKEIQKYLKKDLDYVICSSTQFSESALKHYAEQNQFPVLEANPQALKQVSNAEFLFVDVASETELVRHDSVKLANVLRRLLGEDGGSSLTL